MSDADRIKKRNKHVRSVRRSLESAKTALESENGPLDWTNFDRFMRVGETVLALQSLEWAVIRQDLHISKAAGDALDDAKRKMGLFGRNSTGIYEEPDRDKPVPPWHKEAEQEIGKS